MRAPSWLLLALLLPGGAAAQSLDPNAVAQINAATRARLRLHGGGHGVVQKAVATSTTIGFERGDFLTAGGNPLKPEHPVPLAQVTEIQVSQGTSAMTGFKVGAAIGAALGFLALALTAHGEDFVSSGAAGTAAGITVALAGFGAGVGALIGRQSTRWHTVYRAPAP